jgi:hypothetical protein
LFFTHFYPALKCWAEVGASLRDDYGLIAFCVVRAIEAHILKDRTRVKSQEVSRRFRTGGQATSGTNRNVIFASFKM